jgi:hypothetical protein
VGDDRPAQIIGGEAAEPVGRNAVPAFERSSCFGAVVVGHGKRLRGEGRLTPS